MALVYSIITRIYHVSGRTEHEAKAQKFLFTKILNNKIKTMNIIDNRNGRFLTPRGLVILIILMIAAIVIASQSGCQTSEGIKYGTLQKVSHKTFPCSYYVAEFAFEGGRVESSGESSSHSNTQTVEIDKAAYDTLQSYLGDKVLFDYKDRGISMCGEDKILTMIKRK